MPIYSGSARVNGLQRWAALRAGMVLAQKVGVVGRFVPHRHRGGFVLPALRRASFLARHDIDALHRQLDSLFANPIGARLKPGFGDNLPYLTIVGVLKDVKQSGPAAQTGTELFMLTDQVPRFANGFAPAQMNFVIRASRDLESIAPDYRRLVRELDAALPVIGLRSMDGVVGAAVARPRFLTTLLASFAGLALLLAAVGTYGVLAYLVTERRREIGIRMALGADRGGILRIVLVRGFALSLVGVTLGLAGAVALTRVLGSLLFDVTPTDPLTLALVAGLMVVVAAVACFVPAFRATRVDPLTVLRDA